MNGLVVSRYVQCQNGTDPTSVRRSLKISQLKPLHAKRFVDLHNYLKKEKKKII